MSILENITVTNVKEAMMLHHPSGRSADMQNRSCFGFSFCKYGSIEFTIDERSRFSSPNSVIMLPKGASYTWSCKKSGLFPLINFECDGMPNDDIIIFPIESYAPFHEKLEDIQKALLTSSRARVMSIFYEIIDMMIASNREKQSILTPAIDYLYDNYTDPLLTNTLLAEKAGISEIYFRKLFRERFGMTPKQYVLDMRIKKARQLLNENSFSVTEIAEKCGFSSVYHFCRAFKDSVGATPTEYARNMPFFTL